MAKIEKRQRRADDIEVSKELRETAWHEAGHAVAALAHGRCIEEVAIVQCELGAAKGHCQAHPVYSPSGVIGPEERQRLEEEVLIWLAGPAVFREKPRIPKGFPRRGYRGDWSSAYVLTDTLTRSFCYPYGREQTRQYLHWLYARAKAFVALPPYRAAISGVTRSLLTRRTLGHEETLAAYLAALESWDRHAAERIHDWNYYGRGTIPLEGLSRAQIVEVLALADELESIERELISCTGEMREVLQGLRQSTERRLQRYVRYLRHLPNGKEQAR
jgi:hypothetical protein